jgi:hypothetical protein
MFVLVTGGTGYVGSNTIAALVAAGHRVRVLARSEQRVAAALAPLGVDGVESVIGDVTDPDAVERALEDCEAVIHAASVFSMDPRTSCSLGGKSASCPHSVPSPPSCATSRASSIPSRQADPRSPISGGASMTHSLPRCDGACRCA